jgi:hypothetical protein
MANEIAFVRLITTELTDPGAFDRTAPIDAHAQCALAGHLAENYSTKDLAEYLDGGLSQLDDFDQSVERAIENYQQRIEMGEDSERKFFKDVIVELRNWKRTAKKVDRCKFLIELAKDWQESYGQDA